MQHVAAPFAESFEVSYEEDVVLWAERQAWLLRAGRLGELDLTKLIEEVEGVGNAYRDEIESRLTVLIAHLLKWKYQPGNRSGSWEGTLLEQRRRIARVIRRALSLRAYPQEVFDECYLSGRLGAARETGMDFTLFPAAPPFTLDEALDQGFFPMEPDRGSRGRGDRSVPAPTVKSEEEPPLIRAIKVLPNGHWAQGDASVADTVVLDFDDRHRRRIAMTGTGGLEFLLDLEEAVALRGGDALALDDGRLVEVVAAAEPLIEVRGRTPGDLVRLAWHIGNRHLSAQVTANALRLRGDHVIEEMLRGLGASVTAIEAAFDPEGGAYAGGAHATVDHHKHGDGPKDDHGHKHDHGHQHGKHKHDKHDHDHKHGKHDHGQDTKAEHAEAADAKAEHKHGHKHEHDDGHGHGHGHKHDH